MFLQKIQLKHADIETLKFIRQKSNEKQADMNLKVKKLY